MLGWAFVRHSPLSCWRWSLQLPSGLLAMPAASTRLMVVMLYNEYVSTLLRPVTLRLLPYVDDQSPLMTGKFISVYTCEQCLLFWLNMPSSLTCIDDFAIHTPDYT
ncbi:hypothetical protein COO60DRAFT_1524172 [Scenedesmus sp. NREL 46B-D3]|nr:hypothetical protein COO60DRAFT_1524172 [Scenedesmus sp. NREL 46B-D3]